MKLSDKLRILEEEEAASVFNEDQRKKREGAKEKESEEERRLWGPPPTGTAIPSAEVTNSDPDNLVWDLGDDEDEAVIWGPSGSASRTSTPEPSGPPPAHELRPEPSTDPNPPTEPSPRRKIPPPVVGETVAQYKARLAFLVSHTPAETSSTASSSSRPPESASPPRARRARPEPPTESDPPVESPPRPRYDYTPYRPDYSGDPAADWALYDEKLTEFWSDTSATSAPLEPASPRPVGPPPILGHSSPPPLSSEATPDPAMERWRKDVEAARAAGETIMPPLPSLTGTPLREASKVDSSERRPRRTKSHPERVRSTTRERSKKFRHTWKGRIVRSWLAFASVPIFEQAWGDLMDNRWKEAAAKGLVGAADILYAQPFFKPSKVIPFRKSK